MLLTRSPRASAKYSYGSKYSLQLHRHYFRIEKFASIRANSFHFARRVRLADEAELRLANCDSETRQLFSRPNQVLGYKSAIIGYTESTAGLLVKPSRSLSFSSISSLLAKVRVYLHQRSLPGMPGCEGGSSRERASERASEKRWKKTGRRRAGGGEKRRRMLRSVRFSVKFPEKYELLPEKETSFVQRG